MDVAELPEAEQWKNIIHCLLDQNNRDQGNITQIGGGDIMVIPTDSITNVGVIVDPPFHG